MRHISCDAWPNIILIDTINAKDCHRQCHSSMQYAARTPLPSLALSLAVFVFRSTWKTELQQEDGRVHGGGCPPAQPQLLVAPTRHACSASLRVYDTTRHSLQLNAHATSYVTVTYLLDCSAIQVSGNPVDPPCLKHPCDNSINTFFCCIILPPSFSCTTLPCDIKIFIFAVENK